MLGVIFYIFGVVLVYAFGNMCVEGDQDLPGAGLLCRITAQVGFRSM